MDLSIIIVNYNVFNDVLVCIRSIFENFNDIKYEIIVVDNNSPDKSINELNKHFKDVKLIQLSHNRGFGAANNAAMKVAIGRNYFLVNPDIIFQDSSPVEMLKYLENNSNVGAIGPVQIKPGKGIEYYYTYFPSIYSRFTQEFGFYMTAPVMKHRFYNYWDENIAGNVPFKVDWVMGSSLMVRKEVFEIIGGFDEAFFLYEEETEWQYRMKNNGWISMIYPKSIVLHNHHSSSGKIGELFIHFHEFRSRIIFSNKHDRFLKRMLRKLMIMEALILRVIFNYLKMLVTGNKSVLKKVKVFKLILKFNIQSKNKILNDRFNFDDYRSIFNSQ